MGEKEVEWGRACVPRSAAVARRCAGLDETEVTVLEALDAWQSCIEHDGRSALERLAVVVDHAAVRVERLVAGAQSEPARVRERLRALLAHAGLDEAAEQVPPARTAAARAAARAVLPGDERADGPDALSGAARGGRLGARDRPRRG